MQYIKLLFVCVAALTFWLPMRGEAADLYSVIYSDASYYNGNPVECDWIAQAVLYASASYNVDPLLITAVMETESHFYMGAGSSAGAIGLMQLMPGTAASIGVNPYDPLGNVIGGTIYLRTQLDNFGGWGEYGVTTAVAAYNAGSEAVYRYGGIPPYAETRDYVVKVHRAYMNLYNMCQY
jgi:SPBc2 prophage-derived uncharacterized transglycosylase yomI